MATLTGWTHPYAPFGVPLVDRDETEAAIAAFLDHVEADDGCPSCVLLPLIAREGLFAAALARVLARHGGATAEFGEHARALLAPAAIAPAISITHRAQEAEGAAPPAPPARQEGAVEVMTAQRAAAIARALVGLSGARSAGWKGRAGTPRAQMRSCALHARAPSRRSPRRATRASTG